MKAALLCCALAALLPPATHADVLGTPQSVAQLDVARRLKRDGKLPEAVAVLRETVSREPDYLDANRKLGEYLGEQGRYAEAVHFLENAARIHEKTKAGDDSIYSGLGWAYFLNGEYRKSEASLQKARSSKLAPDQRVKVNNNLGYLYMTTGQLENSRKAFTEAAPADRSGFAREQLKSLDRLEQLDKGSAGR